MGIDVILLYAVYCAAVICGGFYIHLFTSQEHYTRDELTSIVPFLFRYWTRLSASHSSFLVLVVFFACSFAGMLLPMVSDGWFLNSSILFIVMFFVLPLLKKNFDKALVTTGGDFSDTAANMFSKYQQFIVIGFGCGTGTALMYNWGARDIINFPWFILNFIILTGCLGITVAKAYTQD